MLLILISIWLLILMLTWLLMRIECFGSLCSPASHISRSGLQKGSGPYWGLSRRPGSPPPGSNGLYEEARARNA